jgi:nicotinamidase-related amidase
MGTAAFKDVVEEWRNIETPPPPAIVPVTVDPAKTAFFLLDFLREVCTEETRPRAAAVLPRLQAFLQKARAQRMVVVHTTTRNGRGSADELAEAIRPIDGERVYKAKFDKFHGNDLEQYLRDRGIDTVIVTGTSANGCLLGTTSGAVLRGFRAIVPIDGMPAATPYQEQFVAWQLANGPSFRETTALTRLDAISFKK